MLANTVVSPSFPFSDQQPRRYYATPELTQRQNLIRHLLENSEQLLVVVAPAGSGKTTLLSQIKLNTQTHWWFYTPEISPATSPESLVMALLSAFNVRQEGKSLDDMLTTLRNHIASTRYNGQLPIVLIDDAHRLPLATLKSLVALAITGEAQTRLRLLLFCEPQITSIFATPELEILHNTLIHTLDVPALSEEQLRDYIQFYLQGSAYSQHHPFNAETLHTLYQQTHGNPAAINRYAHDLLHRFAEHHTVTSLTEETQPYQKLLWGAVIVVVLLGVAWLLSWKMPEILPSFTSSSVNQSSDLSVAIVSTPQGEDVTIIEEEDDAIKTEENTALSVNSPKTGHHIEKHPIITEEAAAILVIPDAEMPTPTKIKPDNAVMPEEATQESAALEEKKHEDTLLVAHAQNEKGILDDLMARYPHLKGETWLLKQQSSGYTLQILGTHDLTAINPFLRRYGLDDRVALYKTYYRKKPWYVITYGIYAKQTEALDGLTTLPNQLRHNTRPFARRLGNIQHHIQKRI